MADFYGCLESTSFRVKDRDAWLADPDVQRVKAHATSEEGFFEESEKGDGYWAFGWYGQYPSWILTTFSENDEESEDLDITDVIQRHIVPGDVCRIGISGNEKLRYIGGGICWVSSTGTVYFEGTTEWSEKITVEGFKADVREFLGHVTEVFGA